AGHLALGCRVDMVEDGRLRRRSGRDRDRSDRAVRRFLDGRGVEPPPRRQRDSWRERRLDPWQHTALSILRWIDESSDSVLISAKNFLAKIPDRLSAEIDTFAKRENLAF